MPGELTGVAAQVASSMGPETQRAATSPASPQSNFSELLSQQMGQQNQTAERVLEMFGLTQDRGNTIQSIPAGGLSIDPAKINAASGMQQPGQVLHLLSDVNRSALQMDGMMELATSGRHFSPTELLAMQAGMYSIVQEVELTSKVFEGINTAHKQLVNTNIA